MATVNQLHRLRRIFVWVFWLTLFVSAGIVWLEQRQGPPVIAESPPPPQTPASSPSTPIGRPMEDETNTFWSQDALQLPQALNNPALLISMITSVASLIGTLTTSLVLVRKEKRESQRASLENEKLELENAKLRRELEAKGAADDPPL
jgi:hypothetical protein